MTAARRGDARRRAAGQLRWRVRQVLLALRIWILFARVVLLVRTQPLPAVVQRLGAPPRHATRMRHPRGVNRVLTTVLRVGPWRPRCLLRALVLYRLLRSQGDEVELVIGLLPGAPGSDAHAWVEYDGHDVGPVPGRGAHVPLVRYSSTGASSAGA